MASKYSLTGLEDERLVVKLLLRMETRKTVKAMMTNIAIAHINIVIFVHWKIARGIFSVYTFIFTPRRLMLISSGTRDDRRFGDESEFAGSRDFGNIPIAISRVSS